MPRALLIDDEAPARKAFRALLRAHPEVTLGGTAATTGEARDLLARDDYDLVFLDIQLWDGSGFEVVPHVRPSAEIVFVTAYDDHALRAFEVNALDYLLKPVRAERLAGCLQRYAARHATEPENPDAALPRLRDDDNVYLKTDSGARFVPVGDVGAVLSCENYSEVYLKSGEKLLVRRSLKAWQDVLPAPPFARAHRQALINLTGLGRIEADGGGRLLHVHGLRTPVRVSRREWPLLRARLPAHSGEALRPHR